MKILVVDDNRKDTDRLKKWLEEEGWQIEVWNSGQDGDVALAERGSSFIVALVSWDMRGAYNGQELLAKHRRNLPELKIVVMSHELAFNVAATAKRLGANELLSKPLDRDRVMARFNSLSAPPKMATLYINKLRETIKGGSQALMRMLEDVARAITATHLGVLIIGETGTGKELIAEAIHKYGTPAGAPDILSVNIGKIAPTLVEGELFGYLPGAFTDARQLHKGFLEAAGQGTLFLDEIGDASLEVQIKLLRVIEAKRFRRLGSTHELPFSARLICATNRNLALAVNTGEFREDFYHRIAQLIIRVPPLCERLEDVPILAQHFLDDHSGKSNINISAETLSILNDYPYPGNIRQLKNIVLAAAAQLGEHENEIRPLHLNLDDMEKLRRPTWVPDAGGAAVPAIASSEAHADFDGDQLYFPEALLKLPILEAEEKVVRALNVAYFKRLLDKHHHVKTRVADEAGIDRKTLNQRLEKTGLSTKKSKRSPHGNVEEQ